MPENITRKNELAENYFQLKERGTFMNWFNKYFVENVTNSKDLSVYKFRSEGNARKGNDRKTINLKWWAYILMVLCMFLFCLLLNYVIKKINEARLDDRLFRHHPKKQPMVASTSRVNVNKPNTNKDESHPAISMIYTKEDNVSIKVHELGMEPNLRKVAADAPSIELPVIQHKGIKLASSDTLNLHKVKTPSIDSKVVHSICSVININTSHLNVNPEAEGFTIVEEKTETVTTNSSVEKGAVNEFKAKLLLKTDDDVKSSSIEESINDLESNDNLKAVNEKLYNKFLGTIYSNRKDNNNINTVCNVNEDNSPDGEDKLNTIDNNSRILQSKDSQITLKGQQSQTASNIYLQNKLSDGRDGAVITDSFEMKTTPEIVALENDMYEANNAYLATTKPENIANNKVKSVEDLVTNEKFAASAESKALNGDENYITTRYEERTSHGDENNLQPKKELLIGHVDNKNITDNATELIYQDQAYSKEDSIITKPLEGTSLFDLPTKMIQLVGSIGAKFLDGVVYSKTNVTKKPCAYSATCKDLDAQNQTLIEKLILSNDKNKKQGALIITSRSEDVVGGLNRSENSVMDASKCNSHSDSYVKTTMRNTEDNPAVDILDANKVASKDTILRKPRERPADNDWEPNTKPNGCFHNLPVTNTTADSVRRRVSDKMVNYSYSDISSFGSDALMILNGGVMPIQDTSTTTTSTTVLVEEIVDLIKKTGAPNDVE